jgi:hypothetical protein
VCVCTCKHKCFVDLRASHFFHLRVSRDKSKAVPVHDIRAWVGVEVLPHSFLTSALNGGKRPDSGPGHFTPAKRVARQRSPWNRPRRPRGEVNYSSTLSLTLALDSGGWSTPSPNRFTSANDPVPTVYEAGRAPGPVMRVRKIPALLNSIPGPSPSRYTDCAIPAHGSRLPWPRT